AFTTILFGERAMSETRDLVPGAAEIFRRVWPTGATPTDAELQGALAVAWGETGLSSWALGGVHGHNNWGSVQCPCRGTDPCDGSGHDPPYTCFLASDSMDLSAATRYVQQFRQYATPDDGALDFLMQIQAPMRPKTAAALRTGNALT